MVVLYPYILGFVGFPVIMRLFKSVLSQSHSPTTSVKSTHLTRSSLVLLSRIVIAVVVVVVVSVAAAVAVSVVVTVIVVV